MSSNIWNATEQKLEQVAGNVNINDSVTSADSTWSSEKINVNLGELEGALGNKLTSIVTVAKDTFNFNAYTQDGRYFINGVTLTNAPNGVAQGMLIVNRLATYSCIQTFVSDANKTFSRTMWYGNWTAWQELATIDSANGIALDANKTYTVTSVKGFNTLIIQGLQGGDSIYDMITLHPQDGKIKHLGDFTKITVSNITQYSCKVTIPQYCVIAIKGVLSGITVS